jgi:hypothetical protein
MCECHRAHDERPVELFEIVRVAILSVRRSRMLLFLSRLSYNLGIVGASAWERFLMSSFVDTRVRRPATAMSRGVYGQIAGDSVD